MDSEHEFRAIDRTAFERTLERYRNTITPVEEGEHLDTMRYNTIPGAVQARGQDAHLDKDELVTLVTWKLKHGVFRPALKGLVQQNSPEDVNDISRKGFAEFEDGRRKDSIKTLSTLRGIGPATASLMLSVYAPEKAPFFSDELFRWSFYETGKGNGWDRRIKYTAKEYDEMYEKVQALLGRLDVSAIDAEKVAYVLGKHDPSMAGAREDSSKSAKRKAGELDGGIAGRNGRQSTNTATFPTERHGTDSEESRSRSLSGAISFKDKDTDQADDDGVQRPSKASQAGRPKRQKRR